MIKRSFYKETIDIPNSDISTVEKDKKTNTSIVEFLYNMGEKSAANYLEKRIISSADTKYSDSLNKEYSKNEKIKQKELIKISSINSGILERLDKIEKNLIDEQDTSIRRKSASTSSKPALQIIREEGKSQEKGLSWFDMLLGALLGAGMLAFLKGFKNLGPVKFAMKMVEMGWGWLKDKVIELSTTIAKNIMKPLEEILEFIIEKISKMPGMEGIKEKYSKNSKNGKPDVEVKEKAKVKAVDAGKLAKETEKATAKELEKISGKSAGKGILKKIPFLGLGVAGAFAADRFSEGDYVGAGMELSSGILGTLGAFTFGAGTAASVGVDVALMARDMKRANEAVITKLDNDGIIDTGFFGDTTVEDWSKVRNLSIDELKALAGHEDLDPSDKDKVNAILYKKQLEQIQVPESPLEFNDGVKVIFNDREILADKLLESDNKLQEFLMNNPFTDENSVKEETEVNGEKVTQIKFKDEELNQQYIELKEQYDKDFKKYKESRDSQLRNLKDIQEIEGELLTPEQVKNYQMSGMSMSEYSAGTTKNAATQDVLGALNAQYKNITLPTGDIVERIKKNEGFSLNPYVDSLGYYTIGYGHRIKPGEDYLMNGITQEQAEVLFARDFESHKNAAMRIPSFSDQPKEIQDALIDMTYNMGPGWYKEWPNTIKMLQAKDYQGVKNEILGSAYATQVKGRALVNAKIFDNASQNSDTRMASTNANVPTSNVSEQTNINNLNRTDALAQKQAQVQKAEEINRALVSNTGRSTGGSSSTVINNIASAPNTEESYALMDLFPSYD